MKESFTLIANIGRWQGPETVTVNDLNDDTLTTIAETKLKELQPGVNPLHLATQILIWDETSRTHNLIAVYDIRSKKLVPL